MIKLFRSDTYVIIGRILETLRKVINGDGISKFEKIEIDSRSERLCSFGGVFYFGAANRQGRVLSVKSREKIKPAAAYSTVTS